MSEEKTILNDEGEKSAASGKANPDLWEDAYQRFETPEQEIRKFIRRLRKLGASDWNRDSQVLDLFCGRGNGLHALEFFGFNRLEGIDLSPTLAARYKGRATIYVGDCRDLPFPDESRDIAIVQGGLHHLPLLPQDLEQTLVQVHRILRAGGRFVVVEPWLTLFLRLTHALCEISLVRKCSKKFDALATMIEHEQKTYNQWLGQANSILEILKKHFEVEHCETAWGKLTFVGRKK